MQKFNYNEYSDPNFVITQFEQGTVEGDWKLILSDCKLTTRATKAILNIILWMPMMKQGIIPSSRDFIDIKAITAGSISDIQSRYYFRILVHLSQNKFDMFTIDHMAIVRTFAENINFLYNVTYRYLNAYMPPMDALGLAWLCENPPIKELVEANIDQKVGTLVAEKMIKQQTNKLIDLLKQPIKSNILLPYMAANVLKSNQLPQQLLRYGPRSDVDDSMCSHIINASSFSGIQSVEDFAIEALSAKKCSFMNKTVLKKSQYFNRKTRLAGAQLPNIYPGWCGSKITIPFYIKPEFAKNMVNRSIDVDGKIILLTRENITQYVGKTVNLLSIFGCKHTDGFCERCAGFRYYPEYNIGLHLFLPKDIHVGLLSVSQLMSRVTQKILSNKHLIATNSKTYTLPENTATYMYIGSGDNAIYWQPSVAKKLKGIGLRIPSDSMGQISDLILDVLPAAETYSKIPYIDIMKDGEVIDTIYMKEDKGETFVPYLSDEMLEYMRDMYSSIEYKDNGYIVPMSDFNPKKPFMNYIVMNDDLISYVNRFKTFISKDISDYNSVSRCLSDFADIVYHKSELNLFYLEVILRALNCTSPTDYRIPQITDPEHTYFMRLDEKVTESSISMKLSQEQVYKYLQNPRSMLFKKPAGLFGPFFGLI